MLEFRHFYYFIRGNHGSNLGERLCGHEAYLGGNAMMVDVFGYVVARMVYLPAVIEIFTALSVKTEQTA